MPHSRALPKPSYNLKGPRHPWMNPNFKVSGDMGTPTAAHPVKRRKSMGGMSGSKGFHTT